MTEQEADAYLAMLCASMLLPLLNDSNDRSLMDTVLGFSCDAVR